MKFNGDKILKELEKRIKRNTKDALSYLTNKIQQAAPEDVAAGVKLEMSGDSGRIVLSPEVADTEFGTPTTAAHPFVSRTLKREADAVQEILLRP